jgi:hypothetical protein
MHETEFRAELEGYGAGLAAWSKSAVARAAALSPAKMAPSKYVGHLTADSVPAQITRPTCVRS